MSDILAWAQTSSLNQLIATNITTFLALCVVNARIRRMRFALVLSCSELKCNDKVGSSQPAIESYGDYVTKAYEGL